MQELYGEWGGGEGVGRSPSSTIDIRGDERGQADQSKLTWPHTRGWGRGAAHTRVGQGVKGQAAHDKPHGEGSRGGSARGLQSTITT